MGFYKSTDNGYYVNNHPTEADAPLIVSPNTMLSIFLTFQGFKVVAGWLLVTFTLIFLYCLTMFLPHTDGKGS